jgi:dihydrofolate reductase
MAEVVLYIAHSVDGFIADRAGSIAWLKPYESWDFGFDAFLSKVDAVIMGRKTYQECRNFKEWPYPNRSAVVMSKGPPLDGDGLAVFDDRTPQEILIDLEHAGRKRVWLVGGGGPIRAFTDARLVRRLHLFQIPVLLGTGTALWPAGRRALQLSLVQATTHGNGVVETTYDVGPVLVAP